MGIKAILLDLGNVVVFFDRQKASRAFAEFLGRPICDVDKIVNGPEGMTLLEQFERGEIAPREYREEIFRRLGARVYPTRFWGIHNDIFTPNREMIELIKRLNPRVKIIAFSNTDIRHMAWMRDMTGIRFSRVVTSYKVHAMKPEDPMFKAGIKAAGVPAEQILYFDDVLDYCDTARKHSIQVHHFHTVELAERELTEGGLLKEV